MTTTTGIAPAGKWRLDAVEGEVFSEGPLHLTKRVNCSSSLDGKIIVFVNGFSEISACNFLNDPQQREYSHDKTYVCEFKGSRQEAMEKEYKKLTQHSAWSHALTEDVYAIGFSKKGTSIEHHIFRKGGMDSSSYFQENDSKILPWREWWNTLLSISGVGQRSLFITLEKTTVLRQNIDISAHEELEELCSVDKRQFKELTESAQQTLQNLFEQMIAVKVSESLWRAEQAASTVALELEYSWGNPTWDAINVRFCTIQESIFASSEEQCIIWKINDTMRFTSSTLSLEQRALCLAMIKEINPEHQKLTKAFSQYQISLTPLNFEDNPPA